MHTVDLQQTSFLACLGLEEAFITPQVAGGANVGQREVEAVGAFVSDSPEIVLAVLHRKAAAVPVVAAL